MVGLLVRKDRETDIAGCVLVVFVFAGTAAFGVCIMEFLFFSISDRTGIFDRRFALKPTALVCRPPDDG